MHPETDVYREFSTHYLPHLANYLVAIVHRNEHGKDSIGSGVLVRWGDRHFVATARHCIEAEPQVVRSTRRLEKNQVSGTRLVRILKVGLHDRLDIGYLEIEDPQWTEVRWSQLCDDRIVEGRVHVVGFPEVLTEVDLRRGELSLCVGAFGTTLIEETDDYLRFDFPKKGIRLDDNGELGPSPFPEHPRGFSGGGCFDITSTSSGLQVIEYKLLGIQCSWLESGRWVTVVRIKHWCDLVQQDGCGEQRGV